MESSNFLRFSQVDTQQLRFPRIVDALAEAPRASCPLSNLGAEVRLRSSRTTEKYPRCLHGASSDRRDLLDQSTYSLSQIPVKSTAFSQGQAPFQEWDTVDHPV